MNNMFNCTGRIKPSIAKQLAEKCGGDWKAVREGFGWVWVGPNGREVRRYAESVLGWDGYSDTEFMTVYIDNQGVKVGVGGVIFRG